MWLLSPTLSVKQVFWEQSAISIALSLSSYFHNSASAEQSADLASCLKLCHSVPVTNMAEQDHQGQPQENQPTNHHFLQVFCFFSPTAMRAKQAQSTPTIPSRGRTMCWSLQLSKGPFPNVKINKLIKILCHYKWPFWGISWSWAHLILT